MGGQVLGGGIIVFVAVALWMVYLLPSWHNRHRYNASERNAVRLSQALRVLAETSQTPDEVRFELDARTAAAQQKIARRAQAEREQAARRAQARRERLADRAQAERDALQARVQAEADDLATRTQRARLEAERARRRLAWEVAERERQALAARPQVRLARIRRRVRATVSLIGLIALAASVGGLFALTATGSIALLATGLATLIVCAMLVARMARVRTRRVVPVARAEASTPRAVQGVQDLDVGESRRWTPRELPRPLTASSGSHAAGVLDAREAGEALRQAAIDEPLRERALQQAPAGLDAARLAKMGRVDDDEIEAHVRELLRRRAVG